MESLARRIRVWQGDITELAVDAIVNAANSTLLGGGGVDGAIHRAAGPGLLEACRKLGGCPPGEVRITPGFRLRARSVIHTVGPFWRGGTHGEPQILSACYRRALELAAERGIRTIAFPSISTGVYGYPPEAAAAVSVESVSSFLRGSPLPEQVTLCTWGATATRIVDQAVQSMLG